MNSITLKQLTNMKSRIESDIENRNDTYNSRTDNWKESEKGFTYKSITEDLESNVMDKLDELITSVELHFDKFKL